jgi:hypothetical protein
VANAAAHGLGIARTKSNASARRRALAGSARCSHLAGDPGQGRHVLHEQAVGGDHGRHLRACESESLDGLDRPIQEEITTCYCPRGFQVSSVTHIALAFRDLVVVLPVLGLLCRQVHLRSAGAIHNILAGLVPYSCDMYSHERVMPPALPRTLTSRKSRPAARSVACEAPELAPGA